ncbi:LamB/YcsF family protein [Tenuibacillus multivorans]|uniref:5-oxoprolinase subunit A n=1 Tax=Tenuibacillus multivorans TaxID=237069 RepID=A0A1H0EKG0_9BACI|nr:5-oxoprolinase subunit PxpA [Tenuibacillus multivorans]GEL77123.1 UPF0271 protein [Tenuibacillus multivorans]SDN82786.1 UPF0271 protein [Tenuibacillus multivorans]
MPIDLNADLGEGFGQYTIGNDHELLKVVSSANIACGFHAGDYRTIPETIKQAQTNGVAIGAHPGFPDLQGFGRRAMNLDHDEIYDLILYQLGAFYSFAKVQNERIQHVKPHGALYNLANQEKAVAEVISQAVYDFDPNIKLYGLSKSYLVQAGENVGLDVKKEAFADRTYTDEGLLMPRTEKQAVKGETEDILKQAFMIVQQQQVISASGKVIELEADTICLHGDTLNAVNHAKAVREAFENAGIHVSSFQ